MPTTYYMEGNHIIQNTEDGVQSIGTQMHCIAHITIPPCLSVWKLGCMWTFPWSTYISQTYNTLACGMHHLVTTTSLQWQNWTGGQYGHQFPPATDTTPGGGGGEGG